MADSRLMDTRAEGERGAAFLRLADAHLDAAYRLARVILRDPNEAQDATHDAVVQAWRMWSTLRDASRFERWFDRILVNICRNRLERTSRSRATNISEDVALAAGDPFSQALDRDLLGSAITALPPDQRVVVVLRYYLDLPLDEIAIRLDVPAGTVRSRLHYALKRLHAAIGSTEAEGTRR